MSYAFADLWSWLADSMRRCLNIRLRLHKEVLNLVGRKKYTGDTRHTDCGKNSRHVHMTTSPLAWFAAAAVDAVCVVKLDA
jgi:hypothetical protein